MQRNQLVDFGPYQLDLSNGQLRRGHHVLPLTNKAFAVLCYLVDHADQLVTKEMLFQTVWSDTVVTETVLTNCISELRQILRDNPKKPRFIETMHRRGYRFIAAVSTATVSRSKLQVSSRIPEPPIRVPLETRNQKLETCLVGRETELAQLHKLFAKALNGERQVVFVTGEAGMGKTALVEAFLRSLEQTPQSHIVQTLDPRRQTLNVSPWIGRGQCIEQYGAGEAYLPVLEALGRLGRQPGGERLLTILDQYAPTWLMQLPALLNAAELEAVQRRIQLGTRERMLREITEAFDVLTAEHPLVVVLEDLHWSDPSTVELLTTIARRCESARLFVVGTYRAAELAVTNHPLKTVKQELVARGQAEEIALNFLSPAAVREYVSRRVAASESADSLAEVVYRRTDGQPLFMVQVTDYLAQLDGLTTQSEDDLRAVEQTLPHGLRELIEAQLGRLTDDEQSVLAVGSVGGAEFTVASTAAGLGREEIAIEEICDRLARRGQFIEGRGVKTWPDGTVSACYAFRHALYQEVLYARVTEARRVRLHRRIGEREEQAYGERAQEIAVELAMHFEQGQEFTRAVQYRQAAAQRALGQHASREALDHLARGLSLLSHVPAGPMHSQFELMLQTMYGVTLAATQGYADPEVEQAHLRAYALSRQVTDPALLFPIFCGLWGFFIGRTGPGRATALANQLLTLVNESPEATAPALAYGIHGQTCLLAGQLTAARASFGQSLAFYTADQHGQLLAQYNEDPGVISATMQAQTLWLLGYTDQSRHQLAVGKALAHELAHPYSLAQHLSHATTLQQWGWDVGQILYCANELQEACKDEAFPVWLTSGAIIRGWALVHQCQSEEGLTLMQQGIHGWQAMGIRLLLPYYWALLAEAYGHVGRPNDGLQVLDEALAHLDVTQERFYEAELWRLKGELTLQQLQVSGFKFQAEKGRKSKVKNRKSKTEAP